MVMRQEMEICFKLVGSIRQHPANCSSDNRTGGFRHVVRALTMPLWCLLMSACFPLSLLCNELPSTSDLCGCIEAYNVYITYLMAGDE